MNVALDTNAYSDFLRGDLGRVAIVRQADRIFLPLIVLSELRAGFAAGTRETENLVTLRQFLASPRVSIMIPDETTPEAGRGPRFRRMISGSPRSRFNTASPFAVRTATFGTSRVSHSVNNFRRYPLRTLSPPRSLRRDRRRALLKHQIPSSKVQ